MGKGLRLALVLVPLALATTLVASAKVKAGASASSLHPVRMDRTGERWAQTTLRRMSLEEKIGQMIMVWARVEFMNVNSPDALLLREEMQKYHVGGFGVTVFTDGPGLLKSGPLEAAALTNGLQKESKYPLLFAADFERGLSMRLTGATGFPPAMAFGATGDPASAREFGRVTAQEARAVGVQWNWFPVADVNSNPANPIINTRSFGEDPKQVAEMVSAYIEGARGAGLLTTVKHFPGHGDTDTDSHLTLARSTATLERLEQVELVPFRAAIAAGVDSVMIAHITVPAIEPDPDRPASISSRVVTGLLQEQLGFHGLVVTDALDMGALMRVFPGSDHEKSALEAVEAVRAGNDMVIIPADLDGAYSGLLNAVKQGSLTEKRIDASVLKILRMKASVGLNKNRFVDLSAVTRELAEPANVALAQKVADRAVTLVKDANTLVPLRATPATGDIQAKSDAELLAVIFADDARRSEGARAFVRQLRQRAPRANILYVDESNIANVSEDVLAAVQKAPMVIALAEAVPSARRITPGQQKGSASLNASASQLLSTMIGQAAGKTAVVAFGNPYLAGEIPGILTYVCTFSDTPESAASLVGALFGELPIHGHLPISIPGFAERGTGLERLASNPPARALP